MNERNKKKKLFIYSNIYILDAKQIQDDNTPFKL